jgi:phospholipid/cholesterol/gamma-HCH transport system substrate-binding protein
LNKSTLNFWVGTFVLLGLGALLFLALRVGNLASWGEPAGYHVTARFDNIGNLKPRAPVKSAGVVVGRVEKIGLDPKTFEAMAQIKIFPQFEFTKDTIAGIYTSGLLGEQFLGLEAGGDPTMLKEGDVIRKTQSAVQLEKLISQFMFSKASEGGSSAPASPATNAPNSAQTAPQVLTPSATPTLPAAQNASPATGVKK